MPIQPLLFSDFAPDLDSITQGACQDMSNVYPTQSGFYRTMPGLQLVGTGIGQTVLGGYAGLLIDQQLTFAATQNQLWIWNSGVFLSSNAALTLNQNRRRFAVYGNLIIVVDGVNVPYYYSTGFPTPAFLPLPGWPGNFGLVNPSIVETTDYATILVQANSQVLWSSFVPTGPYIPSVPAQVYQYNLGNITGDITAVHRLRNLLVVYRQNAFQCATFVGVDIGWDFGSPGTISEDIGAAGNECVINTGDYHYIWGPDDFWQFDGYNLNRIPNNLKQFIFRDLDQAFFANVAGRYDVNRTLVFWHYPSINAKPRGSLDSYVSLNLRTGKWGFGRLAIDLPLTGLMNNPVDSQHAPDTGVFLPDHNLYLYDEGAPFVIPGQPGTPAKPGNPFLIATGANDLIVTSSNGGNTWRVANADDGSNNAFYDAAWDGHSAYVVMGTGVIFSSTDGGLTWASRTMPSNFQSGIASQLGTVGIFKTVIWDGKQFVAIGYQNPPIYQPTITTITEAASIYTASFASALTFQPIVGNTIQVAGSSQTAYNGNFYIVTASDSTHVSFGLQINYIFESSVGTYTVQLTNPVRGISNGDTIIIANNTNAGFNGSHTVVSHSASAITFAATTGIGVGINGTMVDSSLGTGNGGALNLESGAAQGCVLTSPDAVTWTQRNILLLNPPAGDSGFFVAIAYNGTTYVALEWNAFLTGSFLGNQLPSKIYTSPDLATWTLRFTAAVATEYCWLGTNPAGAFLLLDSGAEAAPGQASVQIIDITESGTTATVTLLSAKTITMGDTIQVGGTSVGGYNRNWVVTNVISSTQVQFTEPTGTLGTSYGGTLSDLTTLTYAAWTAYSPDGIGWTETQDGVNVAFERFQCIWDTMSGQWIVAGTDRHAVFPDFEPNVVIRTSSDGLTWATRLSLGEKAADTEGSVLRGANANLYAWLGNGPSAGSPPYPTNGQAFISTDNGATWTAEAPPIVDTQPTSVNWVGAQFVSLNQSGFPDFPDTFLAISPDAMAWTNEYDDSNFDLIILRMFATPGTPAIPGAGPFAPMTYIISNDFGDRQMVYSTRRLRPGFALYPTVPNTTPTPVKITPLIQQPLTGTPVVAPFSVPISDDGWGNLKVTARLMRFRLDLYGTCELAQGTVDISPTGSV